MATTLAHKRKYYGRKPSKTLGGMLRKWRKKADLTLEEAARRLRIKCKSPGSYLWQMENGQKTFPEIILLNASRVYKIPVEEVLKQAYPHQLHFAELTEVMKPTALPKDIDDYLVEIEKQLRDEDRQELARYATFLAMRRQLTATP